MKLFVGMDGSLAKTAIRASGEHGEIVEEAGAASEPEVLARWPSGLPRNFGLKVGPIVCTFRLPDPGPSRSRGDAVPTMRGPDRRRLRTSTPMRRAHRDYIQPAPGRHPKHVPEGSRPKAATECRAGTSGYNNTATTTPHSVNRSCRVKQLDEEDPVTEVMSLEGSTHFGR